MKKIILLIILISLFGITSALELSGKVHIYMMDTSMSMIGKGDGRGIDIFQEVKDVTIWKIKNEVNPGDYLMIFPFSSGIFSQNVIQKLIQNNSDIQDVIQQLQAMKADGNRTYLTRSFVYALEETKRLKEVLRLRKDSQIIITVFTDGRGNGAEDRGPDAMRTFLAKHKIMKSDYPFMFTKLILLDQNLFPEEIKELMEREGVSVRELERESIKKLKIQIVDEFYEAHNLNSYLHLKIAFSDELIGEELAFEVPSKLCRLEPNKIQLKRDQNDYRLRIISPEKVLTDEKIIIKESIALNHNLFIGPDLKQDVPLKLSYYFKPIPLSIEDYSNSIDRNGKIEIKLSQVPSKTVPTKFTLTTMEEDISFELEQDIIDVKSKKIVLRINPASREKYKDYRMDIIYATELKLKLKMESQHPAFYYQPETVVITKEVKPHPIKPLIPISILALAVGVIFIFL
jgi:hypothetical protein